MLGTSTTPTATSPMSRYEKAKKLLVDNKRLLDILAMHLYEKETITGDEFMEILNKEGGAAL